LESNSKLIAALIAARREMGPALKTSVNPHFKSKFVDLQGVHDACMSALLNNGVWVDQRTGILDGNLYLITTLMHQSGESSAPSYHPLQPARDKDPQALGAAITYARRYSLMAVLALAPEDDDGTAASARPSGSPPPVQPRKVESKPAVVEEPISREPGEDDVGEPVDGETAKRIGEIALGPKPVGLGWSKPHAKNWLKKNHGVDNLLDLSRDQAANVLAELTGRLANEQEAA